MIMTQELLTHQDGRVAEELKVLPQKIVPLGKKNWDGSGISWIICKQSAPSYRQITTPTPHHSIFASSWHPTNSVKALKANLTLNHNLILNWSKYIETILIQVKHASHNRTRKHVLKVNFAVLKCLDKPLAILQFCQLLQTQQKERIEESIGEWRSQLGNGDYAVGHSTGSKLCHVGLG